MDFFISFTSYLGSFNTFILWLIMLLICFLSILVFLKLFGYVGLYVYSALAVIIGNIQVLKTVDFFYSPEPVALGTVLFASTFLCTDILSEHFGKEKAKKNVLIGFVGFLFVTIIMLITIGFKPSANDWSQDSLANVFTPMSRFFIASMIAYLASQYFDVWIYSAIKNITKNRYLWLRNNLSTILSSLVDNTIFSLLAWIILNPNPETFYNVIMIYIFGTYTLRILIAFVDTPFMYFSKLFLPKNND